MKTIFNKFQTAFSNSVYDVVNRKWSIFGTSDASFKNIKIKNP